LLLLTATGAFALLSGGANSCSTSNSGSNKSSGGNAASSSAACGTKATDDCTPRVGPSGTVEVDALLWHLLSARTAQSIGDTSIGAGAKANGIFVVVKLRVRSKRTDSVTLSGDVIKLEVNGKRYDTDNSGTTAAIGAGQQPFFLDTIGPDSTVTGTA